MKLLVIDGQGGGIGARVIAELRAAGANELEIVAAGTNVLATNAMLKAGATAGATGENAVVYNAAHANIIVGPIGILLANSMHGEISPAMAAAVSCSDAEKVLIPSSKCAVHVAGAESKPLETYIRQAAQLALACAKGAKHE